MGLQVSYFQATPVFRASLDLDSDGELAGHVPLDFWPWVAIYVFFIIVSIAWHNMTVSLGFAMICRLAEALNLEKLEKVQCCTCSAVFGLSECTSRGMRLFKAIPLSVFHQMCKSLPNRVFWWCSILG